MPKYGIITINNTSIERWAMAVPEGRRSKSKLDAAIQARKLAAYTIEITSNDKKFPPEFREILGKSYAELAIKIFNSCWAANNIRVTSKAAWNKRKELQDEAVRTCVVLLADIDLGAEVYKLPTKRIEYWSELVVETKKIIKAWRDVDQKRYGKIE